MITQVYVVIRKRLVGGDGPALVSDALYSDADKATTAMNEWVRENSEYANRYWDPEALRWVCRTHDRPYAVFVQLKEVL